MYKCIAALCAVFTACVALPGIASAHPQEVGEVYVPWTDKLTEQKWLASAPARTAEAAAATAAGPGSSGMALVGNADKDGTINSDLAFWGDLAYAGNYGGFRILDIGSDQPSVVVDQVCNGPQNDVSVHEMGGRRFLFQSIDTPQTAEDCSSASAPIVNGGRVGYEGVRVFDVTNPSEPVFLDMIQTACGSHTHTLIPDGQRVFIYVASYPLTTNITPPGSEPPNADYRPCLVPHKKISIIEA